MLVWIHRGQRLFLFSRLFFQNKKHYSENKKHAKRKMLFQPKNAINGQHLSVSRCRNNCICVICYKEVMCVKELMQKM